MKARVAVLALSLGAIVGFALGWATGDPIRSTTFITNHPGSSEPVDLQKPLDLAYTGVQSIYSDSGTYVGGATAADYTKFAKDLQQRLPGALVRVTDSVQDIEQPVVIYVVAGHTDEESIMLATLEGPEIGVLTAENNGPPKFVTKQRVVPEPPKRTDPNSEFPGGVGFSAR